MVVAYYAYDGEASAENRAGLLRRVREFEDYRKHIVELDDAYVKRWFPGYGEFANFLTSDGKDGVYYTPWDARRDEIRRKGYDGVAIGYGAGSGIVSPFKIGR